MKGTFVQLVRPDLRYGFNNMTNSEVVFPNSYDEICVAFDLETTGLDPDRDTIIEIGAVRFRGKEELETYHTLVNPLRELSKFIRDVRHQSCYSRKMVL